MTSTKHVPVLPFSLVPAAQKTAPLRLNLRLRPWKAGCLHGKQIKKVRRYSISDCQCLKSCFDQNRAELVTVQDHLKCGCYCVISNAKNRVKRRLSHSRSEFSMDEGKLLPRPREGVDSNRNWGRSFCICPPFCDKGTDTKGPSLSFLISGMPRFATRGQLQKNRPFLCSPNHSRSSCDHDTAVRTDLQNPAASFPEY